MNRHSFSLGNFVVFAERGALRILMMILGFVMVIGGLAMGVSMVMLPFGVVIGLAGLGLLIWGLLGEVPIRG